MNEKNLAMKLDTEAMESTQEGSVIRKITCEQDVLTRPDGSAQFNHGDTCMLAAVYGPTQVKMSKAIIDKSTIEVIYKPKVGLPGCSEKMQERLIRNTCETVVHGALHPRTAVNIILQEMQDSGSLLACSINAACLALLDASVPMKYMVAAVSCVVDADGQVTLDPSNKEESEAQATFTFAFDSINYNIVTSIARGSYTDELYHQCLLSCRQASKEIVQFYRMAMQRKLTKTV